MRRTSTATSLLLALHLGAWAPGCTGPEPLDTATPRDRDSVVEVHPMVLGFDGVEPGEEARATVTVRSIGEDAALISDISALLDPAFIIEDDPGIAVLASGDALTFDVLYRPTEVEHHGRIAVRTDDPDKGEILIDAWGGIEPALLVLDPIELDFGNVLPGEVGEQTLTVSNEGGLPAVLDEAWFEITGPFDFGERAELGAISPGETRYFDLTFAPDQLYDHVFEGWFMLGTDQGDPEEIPIRATAQNTPIAVCQANPDTVHAWLDRADYDGTGSYNPEGGDIIAYEWSMVSQPPGSAAVLPTTDTAVVPDFHPDLAGDYIAQLIVTNEMGVESEPCEATLTATVGDDLWIELYWQHDFDDMDLHLVRGGGTMFNRYDDCHWENCQYSPLEWGDPANEDDNPSLDFDDIQGTGPENINVTHPADGSYEVWVHDYEASTYNGGNTVTVNVYVYGQLEASIAKIVSGEDSSTKFAEIDFPGGTVTEF